MFGNSVAEGGPLRLAGMLLLAACSLSRGAAALAFEQPASSGRGMAIDDLLSIEDIQATSVSSDGKWVAFQTLRRHPKSNGFSLIWYIAPAEAGASPERVASGVEPERSGGGELIGSSIVWAPDNRTIFFTKKQDDAIQVWRVARGSAETEQVTSSEGDVMRLRMSQDGRRLIFTVDRPRDEYRRLEEEGRRSGFLQQDDPLYILGYGVRIPPCTDGNPDRILLGSSEFACVLTTWVYDLATREIRRAEAVDAEATSSDDSIRSMQQQGGTPRVSGRLMHASAPDGRVAWIENADPERYKGIYPVMVLGVTTKGKDALCSLSECRAQRLVGFKKLWWHGNEIVFQVGGGSHAHLSSFYAWNPKSGRLQTLLRSEDYFTGCQKSGGRLVCSSEGSTSPRTIIAIDIDTGRRTTLVDVNSQFHEIKFTRVELILGEDDEGDPVYGHLVYPRNHRPDQRYPLVVTQYHSYGFLRGATGDEQPIHVYANAGIAVLSFDHRPSNDRQSKEIPYPANLPDHYRNMNIDQYPARAVEKMVAELVSRGIVDPERVGITGFSFGDAVLGTALMRRTYTAASSAGIGSMPILPLPPKLDPWNGVLESGLTPSGREIRARYSFAANARSIDTPLLMQVADTEFDSMEDSYNALRAAGKAVELYQYPDERHTKWQPAHKAMVYRRNLDWFRFWLLGLEDDEPDKAGQYERWRAMREKLCERLKENPAPSYCERA